MLGQRYDLLEELGRGGMGVVYRAHDRILGRDVALKVLQLAGRVDAETIERFQREARAAAALDHPNIVRVHDVGALPDGAPYYTMEMLAGQDLAHAIADGHIAPREAVEAVRQVSLALLYAHQKGILHRDLKPQNIFLRRDPLRDPRSDASTMPAGSPMAPGLAGPAWQSQLAGCWEVHALLLDFGLAKLAERDLGAHADQQAGSARGSQGRKSMQSLTRSGEIFGTPAYMSPEQTHGAKDVDARADIYSLGAALYHALASKPPFDAGSLAELLVKVQRQDPPPPSIHNREVDADLDTIALKIVGTLGTAGWFGGGAALRALDLARFERQYDAAMEADDPEHFDRAAKAADDGHDLAPNDARWRERRDTALYEKAATVGRTELTRWRAHRDKAADLAVKGATSSQQAGPASGVEEQAAPSEERKARRKARWDADEALRGEELEREDAWSKSSVAFTEALTHQVAKEAEEALTELYWDRYVRAEKDRDIAAMGVYESYVVQFGKERYERELRGRREPRFRNLALSVPSQPRAPGPSSSCPRRSRVACASRSPVTSKLALLPASWPCQGEADRTSSSTRSSSAGPTSCHSREARAFTRPATRSRSRANSPGMKFARYRRRTTCLHRLSVSPRPSLLALRPTGSTSPLGPTARAATRRPSRVPSGTPP